MFTGIVRYCGIISALSGRASDVAKGLIITVSVSEGFSPLLVGGSIACNGICLTVTSFESNLFYVDISPETLSCTSANQWQVGTPLNLEPALRLGDAMDGHLVSGHVDAVVQIVNIHSFLKFTEVSFLMNEKIKKYIAPKGSVTIDGVSLTVNSVSDNIFTVMIVPHTWENTIFSYYRPGTWVNIEVDLIARYLARFLEVKP